MIDFTNNIRLAGSWRKTYLYAKIATYLLFAIFVTFTAYKLLFPSFYFDYFFNITDAKKNTLFPPTNEQGTPLKNDVLSGGGVLSFNTSLIGNFSDANMTLSLKDDSASPTQGSFTIQKSYQAFSYPLGETWGFKNGSLLTNGGAYYIISDGKLRKFSTLENLQALGFAKNMFLEASSQDLALTTNGETVAENSYPNGTLIRINDDYYQFQNEKLSAFVSEKAFLTGYERKQAIVKNIEFLKQFEQSEDLLGFADGTLVSSPQSVFFLSQNKSYPFNNVVTFESMGFAWEDVLEATSDEIGIYQKQKVLDIIQPHPDGSIFFDPANGSYWIVQEGRRHLLGSEAIAKSYLRKKPVLINQAETEKKLDCTLEKKIWPLRSYDCNIQISELENLIGNNYQFQGRLGDNINLAKLHVTLKKSFKLTSLKESLAEIKQKLIQNYYGEQAQ